MENLEKVFEELESELQFRRENLAAFCIVEVHNQTPGNWGAKIGGACKFTFQDDNGNEIGSFTDYHERLDISTGNILYFNSNQPNSCVKKIEAIINIAIPSGTISPLPLKQEINDRTRCMTKATWAIQPKTIESASSDMEFVLVQID